MDFVPQVWHFLSERRKYWLLPVVVIAILLGGLLVLVQGSFVASFAPFVYTRY